MWHCSAKLKIWVWDCSAKLKTPSWISGVPEPPPEASRSPNQKLRKKPPESIHTYIHTSGKQKLTCSSSANFVSAGQKYYVHSWTQLMFLNLFLKNFQIGLLVNCLLKYSFKIFLKYSLWMFMQWSLKCSLKYTSYYSFLEVILQRLCKVLLKVRSCGTF